MLAIALSAASHAKGRASGQSTSASSSRPTAQPRDSQPGKAEHALPAGECVRLEQAAVELQQHAREYHQMNLARDQVLAMAQPEPDPNAPQRKT